MPHINLLLIPAIRFSHGDTQQRYSFIHIRNYLFFSKPYMRVLQNLAQPREERQ